MSTIRRLYFYLVSLVSLEVITWALINLVRSIFDQTFTDILAGGLAFILVGLPVFLFHWRFVQREAAAETEERYSGVRAVFLYTAWTSLAIPVIQNMLAIVLRVLANIFDINPIVAAFGADQNWADNLIAISVNAVLAAYFFMVLRKDWQANPPAEAFPLVRRLNRYLWVVYGLALGFIGTLQLLLYIFEKIEGIGRSPDAHLLNALGFIVVGIPLWLYCWNMVQASMVDPASQQQERHSQVRIGVLYGLTLISAIATLLAAGSTLQILFRIAIVESETFKAAWGDLGTSISVVLPSLIVWIYHWNELKNDISGLPQAVEQHSRRRLYFYILSLSGLAATFISLQMLVAMIVEALLCSPGGEVRKICSRLLEAQFPPLIAILLVGVPLWVLHWRPAQGRAIRTDEIGDSTRSSLLRKIYLYLVLFAGVIGAMVTTGRLLFELISSLLGITSQTPLQSIFTLLGTLILFLVFTYYHWRVLRLDGEKLDETIAERQQAFPVVIIAETGGFAETVQTAMASLAPHIPLVLQPPDQPLVDTAAGSKAVILSADILTRPDSPLHAWLRNFSGERIVLPMPTPGWAWLGLTELSLEKQARQAARAIQQLVELGETKATRLLSPAAVIGYALGGVVGLIMLCVVTNFIMEFFY